MMAELKYGWRHGGSVAVPVACAAQTFVAASGKFIYMNAGAATQCGATSTTIFGFLEAEAQTVTANEELNCIIDLTAVFRIPINSGTYAAGMIGDTCDLSVSASVQGATLDTSDRNLIVIVGGSGTTYVDVMMDPTVWGTGLGTDD